MDEKELNTFEETVAEVEETVLPADELAIDETLAEEIPVVEEVA